MEIPGGQERAVRTLLWWVAAASILGPGSIDQAHTADEWLEIEQLKMAAEIIYDFVREA